MLPLANGLTSRAQLTDDEAGRLDADRHDTRRDEPCSDDAGRHQADGRQTHNNQSERDRPDGNAADSNEADRHHADGGVTDGDQPSRSRRTVPAALPTPEGNVHQWNPSPALCGSIVVIWHFCSSKGDAATLT
jgi:hypothetical protein